MKRQKKSEVRSEIFVLFVCQRGSKEEGRKKNNWHGHFRPESAVKWCKCQRTELLILTKLALLLGNSDTFNTLKQCHFQHIQHIGPLEKKVASLRKQMSSESRSSKQRVSWMSPMKLLDKRHVGEMHFLADCNKLPVDSSQNWSAISSGWAN